jgi:hypothetical protein
MTIEFDEIVSSDDGGGDRRGRRRLVAAVAATMLVAAAAGAGYGIGRNVGDDTGGIAGSASETNGDPGAGADADAPASGDEPADTPASTMAEPGATVGNDGDGDDSGMVGEVIEVESSEMRASGGIGYAPFGTQPMETLFERITERGFVLRAQLGQMWDHDLHGDWGAGDWRPAPWCYESGQLRISMSGPGIVDVGGAPWFDQPFKGRSVSWLTLGGNDGDPQWVIVVQTPADVATVGVVFADGSVDQVAPQGGIALLTAPGAPSTPIADGGSTYWMESPPVFELTFEGGAVPETIGSDAIGTWDDPEFRASCSPPPPALPDAGEQPADPGAADAEIRAAMSTLYGIVGTGEFGSDLIDDTTGVAEAREQVQAGGFAGDAASATADIVELVFTTPTEAWFRYSIDTDGNDFDDRYGIAVFVDGVWKVTRSTVCQDLSLAGGDCGPGWAPISPPGGDRGD